MSAQTPTDPALTVREIIEQNPAALAVLHAHGVDACCGGSATLAEAARRHHLNLDGLLEALARTPA